MTVVMLAVGSRGDVQPLACLAGGLRRRGVEVSLVGLAEYAGLVDEFGAGARFVPIDGDLATAVRRGGIKDALGSTSFGQLTLLKRWVASLSSAFVDAALGQVGPGDTVVSGVLSRGVAAALATARGARVATIVYTAQPPTLQRESFIFPQYFSGWRPYDRWGTRFAWQLSTSVGGVLTREARRRLDLPRLSSRAVSRDADRHPTIVAASPVLVPPAPDWSARVHQSGYPAPPLRSFEPEPALAEFLAQPGCVYVGFGSFTQFATKRDVEELAEVASLSGRPIVTLAPAGVPEGVVAPRLFAARTVPFECLFSHVAATIHHGGAGTTHEALRSGVPSVVTPIGTDQPYHAGRLHALGFGPAPVARRRAGAADLARLIDEMLGSPRSEAYRRRARELAEAVRAEDGVGSTIDVLERLGLVSATDR